MPATADPIRSANPSVPVELCHNLEPDAFMWLWMKYVHGLNDRYHCTNCLRGWYGKKLNKANPDLLDSPELVLDERPSDAYRAIYICGVYKRGYPRTNYPHNLHAAVLPRDGARDIFVFENWRLEARNGLFLPIPVEAELPMGTIFLPACFCQPASRPCVRRSTASGGNSPDR